MFINPLTYSINSRSVIQLSVLGMCLHSQYWRVPMSSGGWLLLTPLVLLYQCATVYVVTDGTVRTDSQPCEDSHLTQVIVSVC